MVKNFLKVLVCPLDWGLGHATRCVPVIRHLQDRNHRVIIAADGRPYDFLREYFPDLEFIRFPGFRVSYPNGGNMALKMAFQAPSMLVSIYREHRLLDRIISQTGADLVISDNRFGLWTKKAFSVYITHQLMIKAPGKLKWTEPFLHRTHRWFIRRYDQCWVPDFPGNYNLSGDLSHRYPLPVNGSFIGILSRFEKPDREKTSGRTIKGPDVLIMLSGPEPQRSLFEKLVLKELSLHPDLDAVILQGLPGERKMSLPYPRVKVISHLEDDQISRLMTGAGVIICRPGYSTLMDLCALRRSAVLVPTPGQTEQEYLAEYLSAGKSFAAMNQADLNLGKAIEAGRDLPSTSGFRNDGTLLEAIISGLKK